MKRIICITCLLALLLCACSATTQTPSTPKRNYHYGIYELTFTEKLLSNDHVGNDWSFTYTHNGKVIENGYRVSEAFDLLGIERIGVKIREEDNIDDVGTGNLSVMICEGGSGKTKVTVTETDGRYTGNTAVWEISCKVKLVDKR